MTRFCESCEAEREARESESWRELGRGRSGERRRAAGALEQSRGFQMKWLTALQTLADS